uniref:Uncharacterized protein n=1 Tax=Anguilla anguilla TaxID=7936 RepID=A0A0E9R501_ANGAN
MLQPDTHSISSHSSLVVRFAFLHNLVLKFSLILGLTIHILSWIAS